MEIVDDTSTGRVLDSHPAWRSNVLELAFEGKPERMSEEYQLLLELAKRAFVDTKPILLLNIVNRVTEKHPAYKKVVVAKALRAAWSNGLVRCFYEPRFKRQTIASKNRHATYYLLHNVSGFKLPEPVPRIKDSRRGRQFAHLTPEDIRAIRAAQGKVSYKELAVRFNVSDTMIYKIWNRQLWKDVD